MTILIDSTTPAQDKNFWATNWDCFHDAQHLYGRRFALDVAAEPLTAKVARYYGSPDLLTSEDPLPPGCIGLDALNLPWEADWWCNPPFDQKQAFIDKARAEQAAGRPGMMLLPYEPLTGWWRQRLTQGVIIYEPDGRYGFLERDGQTKKHGVNFGSVLVAFPVPFWRADAIRIPFSRHIWRQGA